MPMYRALYVPRLDEDYEDEPGRCAECGGHLGEAGGGGGADACDCGGSFQFHSDAELEHGDALGLLAEAEQQLADHLAGRDPRDFCVVEIQRA